MGLLCQRITSQPLSSKKRLTGLWVQRQKLFAIITLLLLTLISSCSSTSRMAGPLTAFSSATGEAAVATKAGIETLQNVDLEKSAHDASKKTELSERLFSPFLSIGDVHQRLLVLDALSMYATKMKQLAGIDKTEEIKKNFDDLGASLDSISKSIQNVPGVEHKLPDGVFEALAKIGQELVNLHVANIRDKAISAGLKKTDPLITQTCALIASEFSGPHGIFYDQLQTSYRTLQSSINETFKSSKDYQARSKASNDYGLLLKKKELGLALFDSIANSYLKIGKAHNAILLQAKENIKSDDALNNLTAQIEYTKFIYSQLVK